MSDMTDRKIWWWKALLWGMVGIVVILCWIVPLIISAYNPTLGEKFNAKAASIFLMMILLICGPPLATPIRILKKHASSPSWLAIGWIGVWMPVVVQSASEIVYRLGGKCQDRCYQMGRLVAIALCTIGVCLAVWKLTLPYRQTLGHLIKKRRAD